MRTSDPIIEDWRVFHTRERVSRATPSDSQVLVDWSDGRQSPFHAVWLRDTCLCEQCVHPLTREQVFELADMPAGLHVREAGPDAEGGLQVLWSDGHRSRYPAGWLRAHAYDDASRAERRRLSGGPRVWSAARGDSLPTFDLDPLMHGDAALLEWLTALRDLGLTLVRGVPTEPGSVAQLAQRISFIRETNFGVLFDVASKPKPDSSAYTSINLPPHTDLPTRELQPGLQFLHCLVNDARGGDSIFVDGFAIADALRQYESEHFSTLTTVALTFWNKDGRTDYRCFAPMIALDARGEVSELRYANFLRAPFDAPASEMERLCGAYRRFIELAREPRFRVCKRLEPGEMWVFDNRRVLHARTEFDALSGARHLQGCYVDRDELLSRIRVLQRTDLSR